jgi:hypothetical protein
MLFPSQPVYADNNAPDARLRIPDERGFPQSDISQPFWAWQYLFPKKNSSFTRRKVDCFSAA